MKNLTAFPPQLPQLMRYVHETEPPTLLAAFERYMQQTDAGQSEPLAPAAWVELLGCRPDTIRKMLRHERPLDLLTFEKLRILLELSATEVAALWLANAPATLIGGIVRAGEAGGPHPSRYRCAPPVQVGMYRTQPH